MKNYFEYSDDIISAHYSHNERPNPKHFKLHIHEWYEIYYFINGSGLFKVEGNSYPLESGSILIMRSNESHYIDINPERPYTRISVHFNPKLLADIDPQGILMLPFTKRDGGKLNLYNSSDFKGSLYHTLIQNMTVSTNERRVQLLSNLIPILNEIRIAFERKNKTVESSENSTICNIMNYINQHYSEDISLDIICDKFFISKSQLCRTFKLATGSTVWKYVTTKRIISAHELIMHGQSPTEIYSKCGFNDYSSFFRAYKKHYGTPPTQVRSSEPQ